MTASAQRRRRHTVQAGIVAGCLALLAAAMLVVGGVTLANSREGETVGVDERPRVLFPLTPNAVLAVSADDGSLASIVIATLLPGGTGGSIVVLPVNADSTAGFGLQRRPLDVAFDADDPVGLTAAVEEMLSITVAHTTIVDADGLESLLAPFDSIELTLPRAAVSDTTGDTNGDDVASDSTAAPTTAVEPVEDEADDEPRAFSRGEVVELLATASDDASLAYDTALAVWRALADQTAPAALDVPSGIPVDTAALFAGVWSGEVGVRSVALAQLMAGENPTNEDVVLLDRRDAALVFAQISPSQVVAVTAGPRIRVIADFTDEQLRAVAGGHETTSDVLRSFIGQMLYLGNTVVSVEQAPTGAPRVTLIDVADASRLADHERGAPNLFGDADVRVAEVVVEGVDLEITLGEAYLQREAARLISSSEPAPPTSGTASSMPPTTDTDSTGTVGTDG